MAYKPAFISRGVPQSHSCISLSLGGDVGTVRPVSLQLPLPTQSNGLEPEKENCFCAETAIERGEEKSARQKQLEKEMMIPWVGGFCFRFNLCFEAIGTALRWSSWQEKLLSGSQRSKTSCSSQNSFAKFKVGAQQPGLPRWYQWKKEKRVSKICPRYLQGGKPSQT